MVMTMQPPDAGLREASKAVPGSKPEPRDAGERLEDVRELGAAEALTNQAHLHGALMAGGLLKISGPLTPELVRRGLDWLQDEHPILRAHLVRKGVKFI